MFNENDLVRRGDVKEECLKMNFYPALINAALMRTPHRGCRGGGAWAVGTW